MFWKLIYYGKLPPGRWTVVLFYCCLSWKFFGGSASGQESLQFYLQLNLLDKSWNQNLINPYLLLIDWFSLACFFLSMVFLGCQNHLVVQDGGTRDAFRRCERPPYPTLLTNTNDTRRFSVCSAQPLREVISCSPEMRNSRYFHNGQWKKMWELEPRQTESSKSSLEKELIKVISMVCFSRHSLYMIYVLVTKTLIEVVIRIKLLWAIVASPRRFADSLVFFLF